MILPCGVINYAGSLQSVSRYTSQCFYAGGVRTVHPQDFKPTIFSFNSARNAFDPCDSDVSPDAGAKNHVFEYIEVYYNRKRLHSKLGYVSPAYFEAQKVA